MQFRWYIFSFPFNIIAFYESESAGEGMSAIIEMSHSIKYLESCEIWCLKNTIGKS